LLCQAQQPITLQDAINSARNLRPAFEAARLRVVAAQQDRKALRAFPATRLLIGYSSDLDVGGSDDDLVLSQPIDLFGRTAAGRAAGDALVAHAEAEYRKVAVDIQSEVIDAYVRAAGAVQLDQTAGLVLDALERLHEATRLRVEGGVAPGVQLTRVGLELDQAKIKKQQRGAELSASLVSLAALIGSSESTRPGGFPEMARLLVEGVELLRQRPELMRLAADVKVAEADARLARSSAMPELEIQARRTPWQESADEYGLRVQLGVPVFDYGRVRAESKAASIRANAARRALTDAVTIAFAEIASSVIEVESASKQVVQFEALVATARELVERLRPALTEQATTLFEVIDATRSMRDIEEALIEARLRLAAAQLRYLRATGHLLGATQ
jgi:outer membrane protein TolC